MNYDAVCIKRATGAEVARNLPRRKVRNNDAAPLEQWRGSLIGIGRKEISLLAEKSG